MSIRELTCIGCPMGCQLTAVMDGSRVTEVTRQHLSPGGCLRPEGVYPSGPHRYRHRPGHRRPAAGGVCPHPGRRTQGKGAGCGPGAVPRVHLTAPVHAGDVVIPNVLGTGVDVVATRSV